MNVLMPSQCTVYLPSKPVQICVFGSQLPEFFSQLCLLGNSSSCTPKTLNCTPLLSDLRTQLEQIIQDMLSSCQLRYSTPGVSNLWPRAWMCPPWGPGTGPRAVPGGGGGRSVAVEVVAGPNGCHCHHLHPSVPSEKRVCWPSAWLSENDLQQGPGGRGVGRPGILDWHPWYRTKF